jgi:hypothetical protein
MISVKEDEMGRSCSTNWTWNEYKILVGKPEGKRPLGRQRHRWIGNIRMDFRDIGCAVMDRIDKAQDRHL